MISAVRDRWGAVAAVVAAVLLLGVVVFRLGDRASAAIDFADPNVWVEHGLDGEVLQINGSTGEITARVPVAGPGDDIVAMPHGLGTVVLNRTEGSVRFVDAATLRPGETVTLDIPAGGDALELVGAGDAADDALVLTEASVLRVDGRTEVVTPTPLRGGTGEVVQVDDGPVLRLDPMRTRVDRLTPDGLEPVIELPTPAFDDDDDRSLVAAGGSAWIVDPTRLSIQRIADDGSLEPPACITSSAEGARFGGSILTTRGPFSGAAPRIVAHNGPAGVLAVADLSGSTCFDIELARTGDDYGSPVVLDDTAYLPDFAGGRIEIVDLVTGRVRQSVPFSSVPGRPFELEVFDGAVWANEPQGPFAAILRPSGITTVQKVESVLVTAGDVGDGDGAGASDGGDGGDTELRAIGDSGDQVLATGAAGGGEPGLPGESLEFDDPSGALDPDAPAEVLGIAIDATGERTDDPSTGLRASFRVSSTTVAVGEPVAFDDESSGAPVSWAWDFGDGTSGIGPSVVKIWDREGLYRVELLIADAEGRESSASVEISVLPATAQLVPVADFTFDRGTIEPGQTIAFESRSTGDIDTLVWDFGDGATAIGEQAAHRYDRIGEFRVVLTASGPAGSSTASAVIEVVPAVEPPIAVIGQLPSRIVTGQIVALRSASRNDPTNSSWDFGDGTRANGANTQHAWSRPGTYRVRLTVANEAGTDSTLVDVRVDPAADPPIARFGQSGLETVTGEPLKFTSLSRNEPTSLRWTFGDGSSAEGTEVSHAWSEPGRYRVILTVENEAGSDRKAKTVTVRPPVEPPDASFDVESRRIGTGDAVEFADTSSGDPTAWRWDFGDGTGSSDPDPVHTFDRPGSYRVRLTASNAGGSDTAERTIEVLDRPRASFDVDAEELDVSFRDTSSGDPSSWNWDFGDGSTSTRQNPSHDYDDAGTYLVTLVVSSDVGSSETSREITIAEQPRADFSQTSAGLEVSFEDESTGGATSWNWRFDDGTFSDRQNPVHTFDEEGDYDVTLTVFNAAGSDEITRRIRVELRRPVVDIDCRRDRFIVRCDGSGSTNAVAFRWSAPDAILSSGVREPVALFVFAERGRFPITLTVTGPDGIDASKTVLSPPVDGGEVPEVTDVDVVSNSGGVVELLGTADGFPESWEWSLQGGTIVSGGSTDRPTFSFTRNGTYAGTVRAVNELGRSDPFQFQVVVDDLRPTANFQWTPGTRERVIRFTNTSTALPGYTLEWDFGPGVVLNADPENPRVRFPEEGEYDVRLRVTDDNGTAQRVREVDVE